MRSTSSEVCKVSRERCSLLVEAGDGHAPIGSMQLRNKGCQRHICILDRAAKAACIAAPTRQPLSSSQGQ